MDHPPYNTLSEGCPSRQVLELISHKWTILILYMLSLGTQRHGHMLRTIEGISKKMLTQMLRELEMNGLVSRKVYPVVPPMVEYNLTPLGMELLPLIRALKEWAEQHLDAVTAARAHFQGQTSVVEEN